MVTILINNFVVTSFGTNLFITQNYTMAKINISHLEKYLNYMVDEVFYTFRLHSSF